MAAPSRPPVAATLAAGAAALVEELGPPKPLGAIPCDKGWDKGTAECV